MLKVEHRDALSCADSSRRPSRRCAPRIVIGGGGEFGVAILTLLLQSRPCPATIVQPLLLALVVTMVIAPFGIRYNKTFARLMLREKGPPQRAIEREEAATREVARREHVVLCGFGRVGQNIARVLESQGFEYIAIDLDLARVRPARAGGLPGDLRRLDRRGRAGTPAASAQRQRGRRSRSRTPPCRWASCARCASTVATCRYWCARPTIWASTELVGGRRDRGRPETFEASLMLVSQVLMLLNVPVSRVVRTVGEIRRARYSTLRSVVPQRRIGAARTWAMHRPKR